MSAAEEQAVKDKAAVAAMRGAQAMMNTVLDRNSELERALRCAGSQLRDAKKFVGESAYVSIHTSGSGHQKLVRDHLEEQAQAALKLVS